MTTATKTANRDTGGRFAPKPFIESLVHALHKRSAELKHLAPVGSAPFLSTLATFVQKEDSPAGTMSLLRSLRQATDNQPLTVGPSVEAKMHQLAGWSDLRNPAEGLAQLGNAIFSDLREKQEAEGGR